MFYRPVTIGALWLATSVAGLCAYGAGGVDVILNSSLIQTSGLPEIGTGKFYGYRQPTEGPGVLTFSNAFEKAVAENVPLAVIWSNKGCEHCSAFASELNQMQQTVSSWLAGKRAVFAYFKDDSGANLPSANHQYKACYDASRFASAVCKAKPSWPLFAFYYRYPNGKSATWGSPLDAIGSTRRWSYFSKMYDTWWAEIQREISLYQNVHFAASGDALDRYEAEEATSKVDVDLMRDGDAVTLAATNLLVCVGTLGAGFAETNIVEWSVGEKVKTVSVDLHVEERKEFTEGETIQLMLYALDGALLETNAIHFVEKPNGAGNPLWKTERTAETLGFGEWTADIDAATNKVAASAGDAYTIVSLQGSLWCPDCANTDSNFLDLTDEHGTNRFCAWAKENSIALVTVDIPNYNGPSVTNFTGATIFSRTTAVTGSGERRSGRGYLSRKMVSEVEAEKMREACHFLASANTDAGGFHRPEDRNVNRTGVPVFAVLRKDGSVAARITRFASESPKESDRGKFDNFLARFTEVIEQERAAKDAMFEIENNHWSGTVMRLDASVSITGSVYHADTRDCMELTDAASASMLKLSLSGMSGKTVSLSLEALRNGTLYTVATTNGDISGLSLSARLPGADRWFATVSCSDSGEGFRADGEGSTVAEYVIREDFVLVPEETAAICRPSTRYVVMRVDAGSIYRIVGAAASEALAPETGIDLYRALTGGDIRLKLADGADEIVYQLWNPGVISFLSPQERVIEYAGTGTVELVRTGGSSGETAVRVRRIAVADDAVSQGRCAWSDSVVVWSDGESGSKILGFSVKADEIAQGESSLFLAVEPEEGYLSNISSLSNCTIAVIDTDAPCFERLNYEVQAFSGFGAEASFNLINVRDTDSNLKVSIKGGISSLPSGMKLAYDKVSGTAMLTGVPTKPGTYTIVCTVSERRSDGVHTGFETQITVVVRDPSERNPMVAIKRPTQRLNLWMNDGTDRDMMVGYIEFAATSKGRLSARYRGTESRAVTFAGTWRGLDDDDCAFTTLSSKGCDLHLRMDAVGRIQARIELPDGFNFFDCGDGFTAESDWPCDEDFLAFKGHYTAILPREDVGESKVLSSGSASLMLMMTTAMSVKNGVVRYAGTLPDGTAICGSTTVCAGDVIHSFVDVPVFFRSAQRVFAVSLTVECNGATKWNSDEVSESTGFLLRQLVNKDDSTVAYWLYRDKSGTEMSEYGAYGSYLDQTASPIELDRLFYSDENRFGPEPRYALGFDVRNAIESERHGSFLMPEGTVWAETRRFTLDKQRDISFSTTIRTGAFRGNARIRFEDGRSVMGMFKGIFTPGWTLPCACGIVAPEYPIGSGTFYFRDTLYGQSVIRSFPVNIIRLGIE